MEYKIFHQILYIHSDKSHLHIWQKELAIRLYKKSKNNGMYYYIIRPRKLTCNILNKYKSWTTLQPTPKRLFFFLKNGYYIWSECYAIRILLWHFVFFCWNKNITYNSTIWLVWEHVDLTNPITSNFLVSWDYGLETSSITSQWPWLTISYIVN